MSCVESKEQIFESNLNSTDTDFFNISWNSSSSELEDIKNNFCQEKKWIDLKLCAKNVPSTFEIGERNFIENDDPHSQPSSNCHRNFLSSPILNGNNKDQLSPLLCRNGNEDPFKTSPIIARYKRRKLCKRKIVPAPKSIQSPKTIPILNRIPSKFSIISNITNSPSLFSSQSDIIIESQESTQKSVVDITVDSPTKSEEEEFDIESLTSEGCDKISESDCTFDFEQLISTSSSSHHKSKRKKYKKGSLSSQAQQAISKQRADTDIWKHELYLSTSSDYTLSWSELDESIKDLIIKKMWVEFGKTLMICHYSNTVKQCIVLINPTFVDINKLIIDRMFKLYPPYVVNKIIYDNSEIECYLNISKIRFKRQ